MNCTRKPSSTTIPRDLSLAAIFFISITCSCIVREPSNFMVVNVLISVPTRYLLAVWERSSTNFINSFALSVLERDDLILLIMLILINIKLSLFDLSQALWWDFSSLLLASVIADSFSTWKAKSRSNTPKWNWTCSLQSGKFKSLKIVMKDYLVPF